MQSGGRYRTDCDEAATPSILRISTSTNCRGLLARTELTVVTAAVDIAEAEATRRNTDCVRTDAVAADHFVAARLIARTCMSCGIAAVIASRCQGVLGRERHNHRNDKGELATMPENLSTVRKRCTACPIFSRNSGRYFPACPGVIPEVLGV